ncbi:MAG: replication-relaxation family protein, partial [Blastocatellia bacterium]
MIPGNSLGLSLRSEYGVTLQDVLAQHDWTKQALIFGGLVRTFTHAQIARFLFNSDEQAATDGLDRLMHLDQTIGVINGYKLPSSLGGGSTDIYYVNDLGADWFAQHCPRLKNRIRTGEPRAAMLQRIAHELLVTEAFVRISANVGIQDFLPDEELRRRI